MSPPLHLFLAFYSKALAHNVRVKYHAAHLHIFRNQLKAFRALAWCADMNRGEKAGLTETSFSKFSTSKQETKI